MKKKISAFLLTITLTFLVFTGKNFADPLDSINITLSKTKVQPGQEVTINIDFGVELGSYTFNVLYDKNLFDYVSTVGGDVNNIPQNDTSSIERINYVDTNNPRNNIVVTFKAKEGITTSNSTDFKITANGMANADASVRYEDITTPITKILTVEPEYKNYIFSLNYEGQLVKEKEKIMKISYSSQLGRYYRHARLVAQATTPDGATAQLLATDIGGLEYDILQNGWGDAQGYGIGGVNVTQELITRGKFSKSGNYAIKLSLVDRDNSDAEIATDTFNLVVAETEAVESQPKQEEIKNNKEENKPKKIDKLGSSIDLIIIGILLIILAGYVLYRNRR